MNASDINAFALPGGFMYLNRGLIESAATEGQLAGVMAHEIAHVALRHGTSQATKAYLGQTGLGLLGRLFGRDRPSTERAIDQVGGFGLNALFLKFSRSAEREADVLGAQILARAGYDPTEMATFFETLRQRGAREPGKVERFFSTHPSPADRAARIQQEKRMLRVNPTRSVGGLGEVQAELRRMPAAGPTPQIEEGRSG